MKNKNWLLISVLLIFIQYFVFDFINQNWEIGIKSNITFGLCNLAFNLFFWLIVASNLKVDLKTFTVFAAFSILVSLPDFLNSNPLRVDYDNLVIKSFTYIVGSFIFIFYFTKWHYKYLLFSFLLGIIPLLNWDLPSNYIHNFNIIWPFSYFDLSQLVLSKPILIDFSWMFIRTAFFVSVVYIFQNNFSDKLKSKSDFVLSFFAFKTLIYGLISAIVIALVGNISIGLFTNKVGLILHFYAYVSFLIYAVYSTKFLINQNTQQKFTLSYLLLSLPLVDFLPFISPKLSRISINLRKTQWFIGALIITYIVFMYFIYIANVSSSETELKFGLILIIIILPIFLILINIFKLNSFLKFSLSFLLILGISIYSIKYFDNFNDVILKSIIFHLVFLGLVFTYLIETNSKDVLFNKHQ